MKKNVPPGKANSNSIFPERVSSLSELIDETVTWIRKTTRNLRPPVLDDLGIVAALDWQTRDFEKRMGIRCGASLPDDDIELDRDTATAIFRISQEALTNVARHSNASRVDVSLAKGDGYLVLEVHDTGRGVTKNDIQNASSCGITGMRERTRLVGGEFGIQGSADTGTTVTVRVPIGSGAETGGAHAPAGAGKSVRLS